MLTLCCWFDQKLELHLMELSILLEIKFGHAQISVPKIGIPMLKTALSASERIFKYFQCSSFFLASLFRVKDLGQSKIHIS